MPSIKPSGGTGNPRQDAIDGKPTRVNPVDSRGGRPQAPLDGIPVKSGVPHRPNSSPDKGAPMDMGGNNGRI